MVADPKYLGTFFSVRDWTLADGTVLRGRPLKLNVGMVFDNCEFDIEQPDGSHLTLLVEDLSSGDREYFRKNVNVPDEIRRSWRT